MRVLLWGATAWSAELVTERAYFEDPSNRMTLQEVQQQTLTPYSGVLARGFSASAFWIRLSVAGLPERSDLIFGQHVIVRVLPHYLDEIALYDPALGHDRERLAGDRHVNNVNGYTSLNHNFLIERSVQSRDIWIRLKTNSSNSISIQVVPVEEALALDRKQEVVTGLIIAALVLFFLWSLVYWLRSREPIAVALVVSQGLSVLYATTLWGYWRVWGGDWLTPEVIDGLSVLFIVSSGNAFLWFHIRFLSEFDPARWGLIFLRAILLLFPLELLFMMLGQTRWALELNILMALIATPSLLVVAMTTRVWQSLSLGQAKPIFSKPALLLFYLMLNVLLFFLALPILPRRSEFGIASGPVFGFFSGLAVVVTLQLRARSIQKATADMQLNLQLAEQEVLYERLKRESQSKFMGMLTHELKTPLGVVLMSISSAVQSTAMKNRAKRAIKDINEVLERCVWVDQVEEGTLSKSKEHFDVLKELEDVMKSFDSEKRLHTSSEASIEVYADRQLVGVVWKNLLDNALKYSPKDSQVRVSVRRTTWDGGEGVCFEVGNLPGEAGWPDPERLFSKYYRSAGSHHSTGSGLGVHLSRQIARYLGGDLTYVPDDQYVRFQFCLPV
jgi:two-component system, sensor histidine kinase LadS